MKSGCFSVLRMIELGGSIGCRVGNSDLMGWVVSSSYLNTLTKAIECSDPTVLRMLHVYENIISQINCLLVCDGIFQATELRKLAWLFRVLPALRCSSLGTSGGRGTHCIPRHRTLNFDLNLPPSSHQTIQSQSSSCLPKKCPLPLLVSKDTIRTITITGP